MKVNKTFVIDEELIDNLKKCNASQLICDLLNQHFRKKKDPQALEKEIQILDDKKENLLELKDKIAKEREEMVEVMSTFPQEILDDFDLFPTMSEDVLKLRYEEKYLKKYSKLLWPDVLDAFNRFRAGQ